MRSLFRMVSFRPVTLLAALAMIVSGSEAQTTQSADANVTTPEAFNALKWDTSHAGRELDLSKYKRTFHDEFKKMNVVKDDVPPGPDAVWFAPGHGAYRDQCPLRKDGPFAVVEEGLRLRAEKVGKRWLGANMTSVNTKGQGFAQQYGYFEMTARYEYPANVKGLWTGFWLKSQRDYFDKGATRVEIDINEFYGDDGYHPTVHLWPAANLTPESKIIKRVGASGFKHKVAPKLFAPLKEAGDGVVKGFHSYGGEITPEWVIMYFDRKELGRFPTVPEFKTPLYMLVTNDTRKIKQEEEPAVPLDMFVKEVAVYLPGTPYAGQ